MPIRRLQHPSGATLLELMVTATLLIVLASVAIPFSRLSEKRKNEAALRATLREVRMAIDQFKADWDTKRISHLKADDDIVNVDTGYPASLQAMVLGAPAANRADEKRIKYLRRIPVDPITRSTEWGTRCYEDDPDSSISCGDDVYDIFSLSEGVGTDGVPYRQW